MRLPVSFNEVNYHSAISFIQTEYIFNTDFGEVVLVKIDEVYDGDCNYSSQFTGSTIAYIKTDNITDGKAATIGTVAPA